MAKASLPIGIRDFDREEVQSFSCFIAAWKEGGTTESPAILGSGSAGGLILGAGPK